MFRYHAQTFFVSKTRLKNVLMNFCHAKMDPMACITQWKKILYDI